MAGLRTLGFIFGGLGFALFLAGALYGLLSPPDASCNSNLICEKAGFGQLRARVVYIWGAGLLALAIGIAMLAYELRANRKTGGRTAPQAPGPIRAKPSVPATPPRSPATGPRVAVRPAQSGTRPPQPPKP